MCADPVTFLALAALPLAALSGVLKTQLQKRFGSDDGDEKTE
jgi:hypothetical protein